MDPAIRPSTHVRISSKLRFQYNIGNEDIENEKRDYVECFGPSCLINGMVPMLEPSDVILGRGFRYAWHSGNNEFQALVRKNIRRYDEAKRKNDKSRIVQEIYDMVTRKGRFLKKDESTGLYEVVEEHVAKEKISQAIRYKKRRSVRSTTPTGAISLCIPAMKGLRSTGRKRATRQPELFDNQTLHSVLGPSSLEWPDFSQFEALAAFYDMEVHRALEDALDD